MCLVLKDQDYKIADRNIACYKELEENKLSTVMNFQYVKYKVNEIVLIQPILQPFWWEYAPIIEEGYHSRPKQSTLPKTHLFYIPKGTKYYIGREGIASNAHLGYCSETIVYIGKNNWLNRLKAKYVFNVYFE